MRKSVEPIRSAKKDDNTGLLIKVNFLLFLIGLAITKFSIQDPKGIVFGLTISFFCSINALISWLFVFRKRQVGYESYILTLIGNLINLYLSISVILPSKSSVYSILGTLINLFIASGVFAGIILLKRLIEFKKTKQSNFIISDDRSADFDSN
jgi:hypothetical protein